MELMDIKVGVRYHRKRRCQNEKDSQSLPVGRQAVYTEELREEAVKLVTEGGFNVPEVGRRLSIAPSTISYWVKAHREGKSCEVGKQQRSLTEVEIELAQVKRELAMVKMERDRRSRFKVRDHERDATHLSHTGDLPSIRGICKWLLYMTQLSALQTYQGGGAAGNRDKSCPWTRDTYGPERLQHDLAANGVKVGICRIRLIRKKLGLHYKQKRKFKTKTPNQVWVSDITYIPTEESWLYLAGHKDIFTGEVVGYAMGSRLTKNLISQSLLRALQPNVPKSG